MFRVPLGAPFAYPLFETHWVGADGLKRLALLRSGSPSGMCANLRTVAASNNKVHPTRWLYYCLFAPNIYGVVLRAHSVRGEPLIQRNASGEVATALVGWARAPKAEFGSRSGYTEDLKNGTCALFSLVLGVDGVCMRTVHAPCCQWLATTASLQHSLKPKSNLFLSLVTCSAYLHHLFTEIAVVVGRLVKAGTFVLLCIFGASKRKWAPQITHNTPKGVQKPSANETELI